MLIVSCQKCGDVEVIAGSPGQDGLARAMWTCRKCGAGQIVELAVSKDARRGDLRKIIGGMALAGRTSQQENASYAQQELSLEDQSQDS